MKIHAGFVTLLPSHINLELLGRISNIKAGSFTVLIVQELVSGLTLILNLGINSKSWNATRLYINTPPRSRPQRIEHWKV